MNDNEKNAALDALLEQSKNLPLPVKELGVTVMAKALKHIMFSSHDYEAPFHADITVENEESKPKFGTNPLPNEKL